MTLSTFLPFAAAILSGLLAIASVLRKKPSPATWCFFAGMAIFGLDSLFTGLSLRAALLPEAVHWLTLALIVKSFVPAAWLGFSLTYSRGDYRVSMARWSVPLTIVALLPIGLALGFRDQLLQAVPAGEVLQLRFGVAARVLNVILLLAFALVLTLLEQTFRASVGTMRWRIKFVVLGLALVFGAQLYVRSQAILFSAYDVALSGVESSGLLIGCCFLALAYARTGFAEADVYPSRALLRSSFTVLIVGGYLFVVGVLAQVARLVGGVESFQFQTLVVLVGMAGLAVLLLSDRLRQRVRGFVGRHFRKAQHDSVRIWADFSRRLANVKDEAGLCATSAQLVSEALAVLSVSVWLHDETNGRLVRSASTARKPSEDDGGTSLGSASKPVAVGLRTRSAPFDLDSAVEPWAEELRRLNPTVFPGRGGDRWCVPLTAGERSLGALVLADRVDGTAYTTEDLELLECIGDQITSVLLNLRLAKEVIQARELEAFRIMSAFFVHDLKNAAASLNLMLSNLPVHFDEPAFREDAVRAIGNTARRINEMIVRLSALRQRPDVKLVEADMNQLVNEAIDKLGGLGSAELGKDLQSVPGILADHEQMRSVVTNLLLNARDAVGSGGRIHARTEYRDGRVILSVTDNGCGMSPAFLSESLFRPFQSTKKSGLGIGMFQSKSIVDAHGGSIQVESETGKGTTVRVSLPARGST